MGHVLESKPRRFKDIDALLLCIWAGLAAICIVKSSTWFMLFIVGGAFLIARCLYTLWKGGRNDGGLLLAATAPLLFGFFGPSLKWTVILEPHTIDAWLSGTEYGVSKSVWLWGLTHTWISSPLHVVYMSMPLATMLVMAATNGERRKLLVGSIALGSLLVFPLYLLFPAVGPAHVLQAGAARNCVPSMHMTWALLMWVNSRGKVKWMAALFAVLTAMATIVLGEHYLLDLVAAVPWTWFLMALSGWIVGRCGVGQSQVACERPEVCRQLERGLQN